MMHFHAGAERGELRDPSAARIRVRSAAEGPAQDSALSTQDSATRIAAELLVHIGRLSREKNLPFALSTADEIAALEHCRRIAALRGHAGPTREDLLDAVRSCFVKGDMSVEGSAVMSVVGAILSGTDIGDIHRMRACRDRRGFPAHRRAAEPQHHRLRAQARLARYLPKGCHRQVSRLLHTLTFLNAPFAMLAGGPTS